MDVLVAVTVLLVLIAARLPVALALLSAGALGIILQDGWRAAELTLSRGSFESSAKYVLIVIPFFLAMSVFVKSGNMAQEIFRLGSRLFGWIPGGLAVATIMACAAFAAVSGSSVATVVSVGKIAIQEMRLYGYSTTVAAGVVGAAGTLGIMIPPSISLVLYGIITQQSIGTLLLAGIIPGLVIAAMYSAAIIIRARLQPAAFGGAGSRQSLDLANQGAVTIPYWSILKIILLFGSVIGGIYSGIVTVVEAAATGAVLAMLFMLIELRRGKRRTAPVLRIALLETTQLNSMIFLLLIGSGVFSYFIVSAGVPREFAAFSAGLEIPPTLLVAFLLLAFVPLGMFLDPLSMLLIAVPIMHPVVVDLGFSGIWFAILVIMMTELALITPPFGMNAFVVAGVDDNISVDQAFAGVLWYVPVHALIIALLFAFPGIVTWLPGLVA